RLLLQRLGKLTCARLHLVKQPYVLDCDHRLIGECRRKLYLFLGKRIHLIAGEREATNRLSLAQEWHTKSSSITEYSLVICQSVIGIRQHVRNMNRLAF